MMLLGSREAYALGTVAIGFRLFYTVYVDNPQTLNAGWILALAACALVLPMSVALNKIGKSYGESPAIHLNNLAGRFIFAAVMLFGIFDAAGSVNLLSHSASYMALDSIPTQWIRLMCVIAAALGCLGGVDAVGSTARVWLRILFWLFLIVVVSLMGALNANYLFPPLGPGPERLFGPLFPVAGVVSSVFPIWLLREKPQNDVKRFSVWSLNIAIGLVVAAGLMLAALVLPPMLNFPSSRTFQLDRLLTNGRVNVLLQLPLLFIWFGCYIASLSYSLVFAVQTLTFAFPAVPRYVATIICSLVTLAMSFTNITLDSVATDVSAIKLAVYYAITAALAVCRVAAKKRSAA